jgi:drug/metabolite transporter (DMT)-like permease
MSRRHTAYLYLLIVSIIWGAASPVVKFTLQWFNPWLFLTYRFAISTLIALPYLQRSDMKFPKRAADQWLVLLTGFMSAPVALFLFFEALDKTTALSGSLITAAGPLFVILGGMLFFRDRVTKYEKLGIVVALAGTMLTVIGPLIINGHMDTLGRLEGNAIMLLAVISEAIAVLMSKEAVKKGISPTMLAQSQFVIGFALFLPLLLLWQAPRIIITSILTAPWQAHAGVLFMALLSGTFAYTIRNMAVKWIEVSESALFTYLQPLWAAVLAVLWLRETITPSYIAGGVVIALGVVIAEYKREKHAAPRRRHGRR